MRTGNGQNPEGCPNLSTQSTGNHMQVFQKMAGHYILQAIEEEVTGLWIFS